MTNGDATSADAASADANVDPSKVETNVADEEPVDQALIDEFLEKMSKGELPDPALEAPVEVPEEETALQKATKKYETTLRKEFEYLESALKSERGLLNLKRDKISTSGKNGYFFVQAEVAEYQKKQAVQQKARVNANKKEFVLKMLPVVDAFRAAPTIAVGQNEREESMHKNFGSLCNSIIVVFEKYGYKEYDAEVGGKLNPARHTVLEVIDGEVDGLVASQLKCGIADKDGDVLRRAVVIGTKKPVPVVAADKVAAAIETVIEEEKK
jgi:molecular chaperone GrpE (heat shock protein)|eukprot:CAMPEP_0119043010 /NCGR_PEP_ID=MMETSP1177-20130426/16345_1 /TAXON_ID=2985 /ORGANISM="Ochromonas sp, Strain CCMP1899" /LENGTH=268 /DNA_ID=CAMNT_0007010171 /DNA_START=220 /DNA_END=1026 /DNA_ORIENTATION=-